MAFPKDVSFPLLSSASRAFRLHSASSKAVASGCVANGKFAT